MDLSLQIVPVADATAHEISVATQEVCDVLERLPGVIRVTPQQVSAPAHAKGALMDALGSLVLTVAPTVLRTVLQALQVVLLRQPAPTKVVIETRDAKINFEFDPKRTSLQELVEAAQRLGAAAHSP